MKNTEKNQHNIPSASKREYWYKTDIYGCVLCGKEKVGKERVHNKKEKGIYWYDDACSNHF